MSESVVTLALAMLAILAGSFFILYGSIPARQVLPALLVGVLLLSFGTTIPELAITAHAARRNVETLGASGATIDNYKFLTARTFPIAVIIGSCLANLLLVSGIAGLVLNKRGEPYQIERFTYARDLPALFLSILLVMGISLWWNSATSQHDHAHRMLIGGLLLGAAIFYIIVVFVTEMMANGNREAEAAEEEAGPDALIALFSFLIGAAALGLGVYVLSLETPGAIQFVTGQTVDVAAFPIRTIDKQLYAQYGLLVIGLAVAVPEILVTLFSWLRSDAQPVTGNFTGSTIFNLLGVLGLGILLSDGQMLDGLDWSIFMWDFVVLFVGAGLLALFLISDKRLELGEGLVLIAIYVGYCVMRFGHFGPFALSAT